MADLIENGVWEDGIYQLETSDPVEGGASGVDNLPHKQLANRTTKLKEDVEALAEALENDYLTNTDEINGGEY